MKRILGLDFHCIQRRCFGLNLSSCRQAEFHWSGGSGNDIHARSKWGRQSFAVRLEQRRHDLARRNRFGALQRDSQFHSLPAVLKLIVSTSGRKVLVSTSNAISIRTRPVARRAERRIDGSPWRTDSVRPSEPRRFRPRNLPAL